MLSITLPLKRQPRNIIGILRIRKKNVVLKNVILSCEEYLAKLSIVVGQCERDNSMTQEKKIRPYADLDEVRFMVVRAL